MEIECAILHGSQKIWKVQLWLLTSCSLICLQTNEPVTVWWVLAEDRTLWQYWCRDRELYHSWQSKQQTHHIGAINTTLEHVFLLYPCKKVQECLEPITSSNSSLGFPNIIHLITLWLYCLLCIVILNIFFLLDCGNKRSPFILWP